MRPFTLERLSVMFARGGRETYWRHDVDASLTAALAMGRFEQQIGVESTFFLMTTSPFYTPAEAFRAAASLSALGHRIGWHVDLEQTPLAAVTAGGFAEVSFHCPDERVLWQRIDGVCSAYAPTWEGRYFADSRGRFDFGDPEDHFGGGEIQINLHPEWWFAAPGWQDELDQGVAAAFFREREQVVA